MLRSLWTRYLAISAWLHISIIRSINNHCFTQISETLANFMVIIAGASAQQHNLEKERGTQICQKRSIKTIANQGCKNAAILKSSRANSCRRNRGYRRPFSSKRSKSSCKFRIQANRMSWDCRCRSNCQATQARRPSPRSNSNSKSPKLLPKTKQLSSIKTAIKTRCTWQARASWETWTQTKRAR